jgi:uncharacterized Zn-finger protein
MGQHTERKMVRTGHVQRPGITSLPDIGRGRHTVVTSHTPQDTFAQSGRNTSQLGVLSIPNFQSATFRSPVKLEEFDCAPLIQHEEPTVENINMDMESLVDTSMDDPDIEQTSNIDNDGEYWFSETQEYLPESGHKVKGGTLVDYKDADAASASVPCMCPYCGRVMSNNTDLQIHMETEHTGSSFDYKDPSVGESPQGGAYVCDYCGRVMSSSKNLQNHVETVHRGKKLYTCPVCQKGINGGLLRHMRTHTGERPHTCQLCGKAFVRPCQLTRHQRSVHSNLTS